MSLRHQRHLRNVARKLPVISAYERRISALTEQVNLANAALAIAGCEQGTAQNSTGVAADGQGVAEDETVGAERLFVPAGHFYSPIPSLTEMRERRAEIFDRDPVDVAGVDLRISEQWALAAELARNAGELDLPRSEADATQRDLRYWTDNPAFAAGDGTFLSLMLRWLRPRQLVELGCGFSSACALDARQRWLDGHLELTFVDPYPHVLDRLLRESDRSQSTVLVARSQDLDPELVGRLGPGDIFFVDSTHISKTGSDVNAVVFDLLPRLRPGVIVHIHDMFPGFEYPESWVMEGRAWNELYVIRAFLQYNERFEILLWPALLAQLDRASMVGWFPGMASNVGGSLWLRVRGES